MANLLIIYHNVAPNVFCPDGLVSAYVAHKRYANADLFGMEPLHKDITLEEFTEKFSHFYDYKYLLFVDISISPVFVEHLLQQGIKTKIIDHHKSALDLFQVSNLSAQLVYDVEECGATLTWKELFGKNPMPAFLLYVRDRDLFLKQLPYTEAAHSGLQYALRKFGQNIEGQFALLDELSKLSLEDYLALVRVEGDRLSANRAEKVEKIYARRVKDRIVIAGIDMPAIHLLKSDEAYHSDIGARLLAETDEDIVAVVRPTKISLRANGNISCEQIAVQFGGGGHDNAASFARPENLENLNVGSLYPIS